MQDSEPIVVAERADESALAGGGVERNGGEPRRRTLAELSRDGMRAVLRPLRVQRRESPNGVERGSSAPVAESAMGLHTVVEPVDAWFAQELSALESSAVLMARESASANLPRLDVAYDEQVQEEVELTARCRALLSEWAERVRTRVEDTLQGALRRAGDRLKAYEHEIGALDGNLTAVRQTAADLKSAEAAAEAGETELEVRPLFARWKYVVLITLLILVDWVANVPVFSELLPKDPGADAAWRELAARSEQMGLFGGLYRMAARALHNIDASLLALGVIVFLVFLAHVLGESLRRVLAHSERELPAAAPTIRGQRRQFRVTAVLSFVGIVGVVGFLWLAREELERSSAQRVAETDALIVALRAELAAAQAAQDLAEVGAVQQELERMRVLRAQRAERADYALVISRMNIPILILNLVLAIAAAVAGYLVTRDWIRGRLHSPHADTLRVRLQELRAEAAARRQALVRLDAAVAHELSLATYLVGSRPLRGWEARADRLRAVVPRFRSENARVRGIDTANIAAFLRPPRLDLPSIDASEPLTPPPELATYREQHEALRGRASIVLERMQNESPNTGSA